ncbi:MAG: DUF1028 domain-containing protein [Deltaproteobacteria bacterium]|nr:MAG: DUF1028 domain-containing protein [Deltaproteobacteria bacterium]
MRSCWPFVGAGCAWVESGVGAVVTQSFTEIAHGPNGLTGLRNGGGPADVLANLLAADPGEAVRQVGIVDATGRAAAHTGARCVQAAGHVTADGVAVQANMMERPTVWPAMLAAYEGSPGDFLDRLLAALRAAEAEGGDIRGRQSAALVVSGAPGDPPWRREVDIHVDDHAAPLDELERLIQVHRGYAALDRAEERGAAGDVAGARTAGEEALRLAPGDGQIMAWQAIGMAGGGAMETARALLASATAMNPRWPEFVRRVAASGAQPELVEPARRLLAE